MANASHMLMMVQVSSAPVGSLKRPKLLSMNVTFRNVAAVTHPVYMLNPHLIPINSTVLTLALTDYLIIMKHVMSMTTMSIRATVKPTLPFVPKKINQAPLVSMLIKNRYPISSKMSLSFLDGTNLVGRA